MEHIIKWGGSLISCAEFQKICRYSALKAVEHTLFPECGLCRMTFFHRLQYGKGDLHGKS